MKLSPITFEERMPVWSALAELFLDTELLERDFLRIANILRASPYTPTELESILRNEVSPAFTFNLLDVAGEWAGWHEDDVRDIMTRSLERSQGFRRFLRWRMVPTQWSQIRSLLDSRTT